MRIDIDGMVRRNVVWRIIFYFALITEEKMTKVIFMSGLCPDDLFDDLAGSQCSLPLIQSSIRSPTM